MGTCNCKWCERNRRWNEMAVSESQTVRDDLIHELREELGNVEEDLNWHKAILDGSWPTAREYAEKIIAAVEKREKGE